jgi:hypothetical protein
MNKEDLQKEILEAFEIDERLLPVKTSKEEQFAAFRKLLIQRIEELAEKNMDKLMWLLYRVDVSEKKLHALMKQTPPAEASALIADLIIERQVQKINSRREFGGKENDWNFDV